MMGMDKTLAFLCVLLLSASMATVLPVKAESRTIVVPDDYATVSLAIENAAAGDTVYVKQGTYYEQSLQLNKSISFIGEGVGKTILNLNPPIVKVGYLMQWIWVPDTAITVNANDVKIQGFSINLPSDNYGVGSAIYGTGDKITLAYNDVANRSVYLRGSTLNITGNQIPATLEVVGSNQAITNNIIHDNLKIQGSSNLISGNTIGGGYFFSGIQLKGSNNVIVVNTFSSMEVDDSNSNFIVDNSFARLVLREFGHGGCSDNTISKNLVTGNGGVNDGIHLWQGSNNTFSANTISNCQYGLALGDSNSDTWGNSVFLNNFLNNSEWHVNANYTLNRFDNGAQGNYYDDYRGSDGNGDGVGDSPYTIEETSWRPEQQREVTTVFYQDNYPLMTPYNIDRFDVELPNWVDSEYILGPDPAPFPTLIVASLAVTVIAVGAGVAVYFGKIKKTRKVQ